MTVPIRVLHVIPSLGPLRGGAGSALLELTNQLAVHQLDVDIATTDDNGPGRLDVPLGRPVGRHGCRIWYFPRQTRLYTFSWPLTLWLHNNVAAYDLVHVHALFSYPSIAASAIAKMHGVPYIVEPLGTLNQWGMRHRRPRIKQISLRLVEKRVLEGAAAVRFTSSEEAAEAERLNLTIEGTILPLGLDTTPFQTLPPSRRLLQRYPLLKGRRIILFLSRIDPKKGMDLLLPAFAVVHKTHPDTALVIAGEGASAYVTALQARAETLGIGEHVVWTGFLAGEERLAALAAAAAFVLPSYSENFGMAPLEALAAGVPVVISDHVAISREAGETQSALVVPCDVESLGDAMTRVLDDQATSVSLATRGPRLVRECFSSEAAARRLLSFYRRILTTGMPAGG